MNLDRSKIKKILVIKQRAIGDVLLSTPVAENLRYYFPDAEINFLTESFCKDVLTDNPFITRILTYDLGIENGYFIVKMIRRQKYDLVIDLFGNPRTAIITLFCGAKYKMGFRFSWRAMCYNIKMSPRGGEVHNIQFNLDCIRELGLKVISERPKMFLSPIHKLFAENFFKDNNLDKAEVIGVNPCGTWETKVWLKEYFSGLMKMFDSGTKFLLFWGNEKEKRLCEDIAEEVKSSILIPAINLRYAASLMKRCKLFLSNDTGPMHIAWVNNVPTAVIFGPTNPNLQGPLCDNSIVIKNDRMDCLCCNKTMLQECPFQHNCMKDLKPEEVFAKLSAFIKKI